MSMPEFPPVDTALNREHALNMILASIAMEELALSHIMNAESEKIQKALDLVRLNNTCSMTYEILRINNSVSELLDKILQNQLILKGKMEKVLQHMPCLPNPCDCRPNPCDCRPNPCDCRPNPCDCRPNPCDCKPNPCDCKPNPCDCKPNPCGNLFRAENCRWRCGTLMNWIQKSKCVENMFRRVPLPSRNIFMAIFTIEGEIPECNCDIDKICTELQLFDSRRVMLRLPFITKIHSNRIRLVGKTILEVPGSNLEPSLGLCLKSDLNVRVQSGCLKLIGM